MPVKLDLFDKFWKTFDFYKKFPHIWIITFGYFYSNATSDSNRIFKRGNESKVWLSMVFINRFHDCSTERWLLKLLWFRWLCPCVQPRFAAFMWSFCAGINFGKNKRKIKIMLLIIVIILLSCYLLITILPMLSAFVIFLIECRKCFWFLPIISSVFFRSQCLAFLLSYFSFLLLKFDVFVAGGVVVVATSASATDILIFIYILFGFG